MSPESYPKLIGLCNEDHIKADLNILYVLCNFTVCVEEDSDFTEVL